MPSLPTANERTDAASSAAIPSTAIPSTATHARAPIEVGWIVTGALDTALGQSARDAMRRFVDYLRGLWPEFDWQSTLVVRRSAALDSPVEPVVLLDLGMAELDAARWDFAFVITDAELRTYDKPFALGVTARSYGVAVLSTARLQPESWSPDESPVPSEVAGRLFALAVHELGHLNDLDHHPDPSDYMFDLKDPRDLDPMQELAPEACATLRGRFAEVADLRVEERTTVQSAALFYLRAAWTNRRPIASSVIKMRPWAFPLRLSKLTTAALSTMVVFLITAEAWELGMRQRPALVILLSAFALTATSIYVLERQRLIERLRTKRFSEQRVLGNVSMTAAVFLGMATTYALLFAATLATTQLVFDGAIVSAWTGLPEDGVQTTHYLVLSGFIAAVGIVIGSLGASFEAEGYLRHVALVDEET